MTFRFEQLRNKCRNNVNYRKRKQAWTQSGLLLVNTSVSSLSVNTFTWKVFAHRTWEEFLLAGKISVSLEIRAWMGLTHVLLPTIHIAHLIDKVKNRFHESQVQTGRMIAIQVKSRAATGCFPQRNWSHDTFEKNKIRWKIGCRLFLFFAIYQKWR